MGLPLGTAAVVLIVLLWELARPTLSRALIRARELWAERRRAVAPAGYDPGRERRAEQRARALLRSCVGEHEWAMYRDLGFLRVWGGVGAPTAVAPQAAAGGDAHADAGAQATGDGARREGDGSLRERNGPRREGDGPHRHGDRPPAPYAYLIYPHKPIVAYLSATGELLNEYCVAFPDETKPYGSARLPDSDDVLAKWMALTADERQLVGEANMHLPGRQVDPDRVRRDLARLQRWERARKHARERARTPAGQPVSRPVRGDLSTTRPVGGEVGNVRAA